MTKNLIALVAFVAFCSVVGVRAQDETLAAAAGERYVISAKAGGVNYVEGAVGIARTRGHSGRLIKGDRVEVGDRVSTGPDARAEILLNPGSFARIGGNSAFEFVTTSLDDLKLKLDRGTAILEVYATNEFRVTVLAGNARYQVLETGVYRIDVASDGASVLKVWDGLALVGNSAEEVGKGQVATASGSGAIGIAKFDRGDRDEFDLWSRTRGKELAKLSGRLRRDRVGPALWDSFMGNGWNFYNSFGLWVYDPFSGGHCFIPFGHGWQSPYGYWYSHSIYWYKPPRTVFPVPNYPGSGPAPAANVARDRWTVPPFVRMQDAMGDRRGSGTVNNGNWNDSSSSPAPVYVPPPAPPPATGSRNDTGSRP